MEKTTLALRAPAAKAIGNLWIACGLVIAAYVLTFIFMEGKIFWTLFSVISLLLLMVAAMLISFYTIPRVLLEADEEHYYLHARSKKKEAVIAKNDLLVASGILATGTWKHYTYGTLVLVTLSDNYALPFVKDVAAVADSLPTREKEKGRVKA